MAQPEAAFGNLPIFGRALGAQSPKSGPLEGSAALNLDPLEVGRAQQG